MRRWPLVLAMTAAFLVGLPACNRGNPDHALAPPTGATSPTLPPSPADSTVTRTPSPTTSVPSRTPTIVAHCYDPVFGSVTGCPGAGGPLHIATSLACTWQAGDRAGVYHIRATLRGDGRPVPNQKLDWSLPPGAQLTFAGSQPNGYTDYDGMVALTVTSADARPAVLTGRYPGSPPRGGVSTVGEPSQCTVELRG